MNFHSILLDFIWNHQNKETLKYRARVMSKPWKPVGVHLFLRVLLFGQGRNDGCSPVSLRYIDTHVGKWYRVQLWWGTIRKRPERNVSIFAFRRASISVKKKKNRNRLRNTS